MATIVREGVTIYYEVHGEGEPLVLIGGIGQQCCMWKYTIEGLKESFRIIAFDNRGAGKSDKPQTGYTMDAFVEDTMALINSLGLNKPHILGFSMGGFIAQALTYKYGDVINKLILVNTAFGGPKYVPPSMEVINALFQGPTGETPLERGINALKYDFTDEFMKEHRDIVEEIVNCSLKNPQPAYAYQGQAAVGATFNMEAEVKNIKNKTLVIVSDKDRIVPKENGIELQKVIPQAELAVIKDAGHIAFVEKPEEFNNIVKNFLKGAC